MKNRVYGKLMLVYTVLFKQLFITLKKFALKVKTGFTAL